MQFEKVVRQCNLAVAPMVEQSELAWRLLSRKFGATLTFTPMFHAKMFSESIHYRQQHFSTWKYDAPLIVQFCANNPIHFVNAAKIVQDHCIAVDLNLGCPQHIARKGHYGSFLQDDWDLIKSIVELACQELRVPITCKIRVFKDHNRTIEYAKMLEAAGCSMLTVHGRLREQKGHFTGLADWKQIQNVKKAVNIPVFSNGNILYHEDLQKCFNETGADGVMSAGKIFYNSRRESI
jgi:tRNA-dihydrouridine synthase 1